MAKRDAKRLKTKDWRIKAGRNIVDLEDQSTRAKNIMTNYNRRYMYGS